MPAKSSAAILAALCLSDQAEENLEPVCGPTLACCVDDGSAFLPGYNFAGSLDRQSGFGK